MLHQNVTDNKEKDTVFLNSPWGKQIRGNCVHKSPPLQAI